MDSLSTKIWGSQLASQVLKELAIERLLPPQPPMQGPVAPMTVKEQLSSIISEFMAYDGDPDGAAEAVMEFYGQIQREESI